MATNPRLCAADHKEAARLPLWHHPHRHCAAVWGPVGQLHDVELWPRKHDPVKARATA
jgi:hypothetical protein